jgi:hypothetical protein
MNPIDSRTMDEQGSDAEFVAQVTSGTPGYPQRQQAALALAKCTQHTVCHPMQMSCM